MRHLRSAALAVFGAALLAGCATPPAAPGPAPGGRAAASPRSVASEFAWAAAPGSNRLKGVVAYRPDRRTRWGCDGQSVVLMPDAPASRARVVALYGSDSFAVRPVEEVKSHSAGLGEVSFDDYVRHTACDASGAFSFDGVPDGGWYVVARAVQLRPKPAAGDEGVAIMQRIVLAGGRETEVRVPAF